MSELKIGAKVQYYADGWYCGYVEEIKKVIVHIRPIGPDGAPKKRLVRIHVENVRAI